MYLSSLEFSKTLEYIFEKHGAASLCFHTDMLAFGFLDSSSNPRDAVRRHAEALMSAVGARPLLFPTFNYDYTRTRVYNVETDPCQVGALNEHFRRQSFSSRTLTPVFNFCAMNDVSGLFSLKAASDPFGEGSTFEDMRRAQTWICMLGAPLAQSLTMNHHVEQSVGIGYRYPKNFPGKVVTKEEAFELSFSFRARVLNHAMPPYDFARWDWELSFGGLLYKYPLGKGEVAMLRSDLYFDYWYAKLKKNELHPFSLEGQNAVRALYEKYGYPFTLEMFEAPQAC